MIPNFLFGIRIEVGARVNADDSLGECVWAFSRFQIFLWFCLRLFGWEFEGLREVSHSGFMRA